MKSIDPLQMQRLADGELSIEQIKQVVQQADASPEQWTTIGKMLVEDKIWQQQIVVADQPVTCLAESKSVITPPQNRSAMPAWTKWASLAASLAVAVVVGYGVGNFTDGATGISSPTQIAGADTTDTQPPDQDQLADTDTNLQTAPAFSPAGYYLRFPEDDDSAASHRRLPMYSVNNADQLRKYQQQQEFEPISQELMQKLASAGYRVRNQIELISGDLDNRQKFVVPMRTIRLESSQ